MKSKYGIDWPDDATEVTMLLGAYRVTRSPEHMYNAILQLWDDRYLSRDYWLKLAVEDWCSAAFQTWIGPGSTGKTTRAAIVVLTHWLSAPKDTMVNTCSTTREKLMQRIFGEVLKYYELLDPIYKIGKYIKSGTKIIYDDSHLKSGIFGVALLSGTTEKALGNLLGTHNLYNVLVIDEMQATREAAIKSLTNLSSSGLETLFLGIGNPTSRLDPLGVYSEPVGGWSTVNPHSLEHTYQTKFGVCRFYDGRKSPAIVEPDGKRKYPHLLNEDAIKETIRLHGEDSPEYWSQRIGFFPPDNVSNNFFTDSFLSRYNALSKEITWRGGYRILAGLDPAFSAGGDKCILQFILVGIADRGRVMIFFEDPILIDLKLSSTDYISNVIADQVVNACVERGVSAKELAVDCSGNQIVLADILDSRLSLDVNDRIYRIQFAGKVTEKPINIDSVEPAKDVYHNRVSELWGNLYQFISFDRVRGLSVEAAKELVARKIKSPSKPFLLESKVDMKKRFGHSPDMADACVIATALLKDRFGLIPGGDECELFNIDKYRNKFYNISSNSSIRDDRLDIDDTSNWFSNSDITEIGID